MRDQKKYSLLRLSRYNELSKVTHRTWDNPNKRLCVCARRIQLKGEENMISESQVKNLLQTIQSRGVEKSFLRQGLEEWLNTVDKYGDKYKKLWTYWLELVGEPIV